MAKFIAIIHFEGPDVGNKATEVYLEAKLMELGYQVNGVVVSYDDFISLEGEDVS